MKGLTYIQATHIGSCGINICLLWLWVVHLTLIRSRVKSFEVWNLWKRGTHPAGRPTQHGLYKRIKHHRILCTSCTYSWDRNRISRCEDSEGSVMLLPTVSSCKPPFLLFPNDIRELDLEFFISKVWIGLFDFFEGLGLCRLDLIDVAFLYVLVVERTLPI